MRLSWPAVVGLAGLLLVAGGCSVVRTGTSETKSMIQSLSGTGGKSGATNTVTMLQTEVMREADLYVASVAQATDNFRAKVATTEARNAAQQWKLIEATAAYVNATEENPILGAVDMVVLASLSVGVIEDEWVGGRFGEVALPLLEAHRQLESNAWSVIRGVLTPAQQKEIRELLHEYRRTNPHMTYVVGVRLPEVVATLGSVPRAEKAQKAGSLFNLLYLNPLAGLDPTTQAIQQTRMLAQRAMYYAQRAPMLLGWQVELTTYQLAAQPEARRLLSDVDDVARSTKVFAKTADGLPKLVNDQREAAINQLFAGIAAERTNLIADLASQESRLRELLPQVRDTLSAGGAMATSLNAAITSLDAFVHYVSPPDTNTLPQPVDTNSQPFNVLDYGKAAGEIGAMAKDINALLVSVDQSLPQVTRVSQQATADAKEVANHAFRLGLVLILALGIVAVLVVWVHRKLSRAPARTESAAASRVE